MTKILIISDSNLDKYFEDTMNYLHEKYHTYPTGLNEGDDLYYTEFDGQRTRRIRKKKLSPIGKRVV